jgi:hypothetical protein
MLQQPPMSRSALLSFLNANKLHTNKKELRGEKNPDEIQHTLSKFDNKKTKDVCTN